MVSKTVLCLLGSVLVLSACASNDSPESPGLLSPSAADLKDRPEPVEPDPETATEAAYEDYNDAVLLWGRSLRDALARVRVWHENQAKRQKR